MWITSRLRSGWIVGTPPTGVSDEGSCVSAASHGMQSGRQTVIRCQNLLMSPAFTIAHYRVTAKLGEGGMGVVYRATDTKLNRDVAIKILPDAFAGDAERMARFAREAQLLASLNHPNIAAIYGTEERALVMELVEGPTLAERLNQGLIPLEETLAIANQIAE